MNLVAPEGPSGKVAEAKRLSLHGSTTALRGTRVIFSDVDGTLLSDRGQAPANWNEIRESLSDALIVLTSSRTVEELLAVQDFLGIRGPVIAENGAILVLADEWIDRLEAGSLVQVQGRPLRLVHFGTPVEQFREVVERAAREHGVELDTLRQVSSAALHHPSGTFQPIASHALARTHSLLVRLHGVGEARSRFLSELASARLTVTHSGRWHVVQGNSNKGLGVRAFTNLATTILPRPIQVIGVGDRENDVTLLTAVSRRFVMRLPNGEVDPMLAAVANTTILSTPGVDGWTEIAASLHITPAPEFPS